MLNRIVRPTRAATRPPLLSHPRCFPDPARGNLSPPANDGDVKCNVHAPKCFGSASNAFSYFPSRTTRASSTIPGRGVSFWNTRKRYRGGVLKNQHVGKVRNTTTRTFPTADRPLSTHGVPNTEYRVKKGKKGGGGRRNISKFKRNDRLPAILEHVTSSPAAASRVVNVPKLKTRRSSSNLLF